MKQGKFKTFVGPWINKNGVAIYENNDDPETRILVAETSDGEELSQPRVISIETLEEMTEDPYDTAQHTVDALRYCGVDIH